MTDVSATASEQNLPAMGEKDCRWWQECMMELSGAVNLLHGSVECMPPLEEKDSGVRSFSLEKRPIIRVDVNPDERERNVLLDSRVWVKAYTALISAEQCEGFRVRCTIPEEERPPMKYVPGAKYRWTYEFTFWCRGVNFNCLMTGRAALNSGICDVEWYDL